jgi:hypothetical protein
MLARFVSQHERSEYTKPQIGLEKEDDGGKIAFGDDLRLIYKNSLVDIKKIRRTT